MKAIDTEYHDYKFRSRLEARWAVFFDACGVKWEYEPEGFDLGDGIYYLPDFLLHDVLFRDSDIPHDLWVEVKGQMTADDAKKIIKFASNHWVESEDDFIIDNPTLIVTNIPDGDDVTYFMRNLAYGGDEPYPFNFALIDGDYFAAFPYINKQGCLVIADDNYRCAGGHDDDATAEAYRLARQARFEHGEKPQIGYCAEPVDLLTAPGEIDIDILAVTGRQDKFVKAARIYSAFTRLDAGISPAHPIIRAADAINAKTYRFYTTRLSGGASYGYQSYCFAVDDIPKILGQYVEHHHRSKSEKQIRYNQAARELRTWFKNEVIPKYGCTD